MGRGAPQSILVYDSDRFENLGELFMSNDRNKKPQVQMSGDVRLNVFLQEHGVASRRKADELISSGMVKVNGKSVTQLGARISRDDRVHVHGKLVGTKSLPKVVYILNKPDMCLTTRFDVKARRTIFDLPSVKNLPPNVQAVGRLDYRSEGLLLLTNDGDLAYALTHPRFSVEKTYAVLVSDGVTIEDVEKLRAGVMLDDGLAKAVSVRMGNKERMGATRGQWLELVVTEGRNRLIRRMAEAIGLKVVRLVRVAVGEILLPATLKPGFALPVDADGLEQLELIKADMMQALGSNTRASSNHLDDATRTKRKMKRQLKLNDEEYALEASRRSAEAADKRRLRNDAQKKQEDALVESAPMPRPRRERTDGPHPRNERSARGDRAQPRGNRGADSDRPQPRGNRGADSDRPQPRGNRGADSDRPQPRGNRAAGSDRPQPRGNRGADSDRPQPRGNRGADSNRPQPRGNRAAGSDRPQSRPTSRSSTGQKRR